MATISSRVSLLATDVLKRADVTTMLTNQYVEAYRRVCSRVPFEDLQYRETKACTIDNPIVDLTTLTYVMSGIMSIQLVVSSSRARRLRRSHYRNLDNRVVPASREPNTYSRFGRKIELDPPPNSAYDLKIRYWREPLIDGTAGNTVLLVPDAWLQLLDWECMYTAYTILGRTDLATSLMMGSMQPKMPSPKKIQSSDMGLIPRLWNELLITIAEREHVDENFSINPVR